MVEVKVLLFSRVARPRDEVQSVGRVERHVRKPRVVSDAELIAARREQSGSDQIRYRIVGSVAIEVVGADHPLNLLVGGTAQELQLLAQLLVIDIVELRGQRQRRAIAVVHKAGAQLAVATDGP